MKHKMKNLVSNQDKTNLIVKHENSNYLSLPFFKTHITLSNSSDLEKFIKSIESLIRKSGVYKGYIKYLKQEIGLNRCMIFSELTDEDVTIEMHHSIFTLFDCVSITLIKFLKENKQISSFDIAKEVLDDHINNLIPVVMVSKMVHEAVHNGRNNMESFFIPLESSWGDIVKYVEKYKGCLTPEHIAKLKKYAIKYSESINNKTDIFKVTMKTFKNLGIIH